MFHTYEEAESLIKENNIRLIDLKWCDLNGMWHHLTLSANEFTPELLDDGVGFDGSSAAFKSVNSSDMSLMPDMDTAFIDPFFDEITLSFICNIIESDTKKPFVNDPRQFVIRAEKYLNESKIGTVSFWGPEFEFFIFDQVHFRNERHTAGYRLGSNEADWDHNKPSQANLVPRFNGYHRIPPSDHLSNLRSEMTLMLEDAGVPVKYHHHEGGGPGHCEIETPMLGMMDAADATMMVKYFARQVADSYDMAVTFLPKPMHDEAGSGMHFHQNLFKGKTNLFYNPQQKGGLSQSGLYYLGGILAHAPALLALTNPSTNSYRRLIPGFEAPTNLFFGSGDRSAAARIPKYAIKPDDVRFEFRSPDATCNPYLAMPAMLMAGLDGIKHKIDPTQAGFGPFDEDIHTMPKEEREKIKALPATLEEAVKALEVDHQFLLEGGVFNKEMLAYWMDTKLKQHRDIQSRPHPREIELWFDF